MKLYDAAGNIIRTFSELGRANAKGGVVIARTADVTTLVEANKRDQKERQKSKWRRQIGRVSKDVLYQWAMADGLTPDHIMRMPRPEFFAWVRRKLANSDNAYMRTVERL
jgi:hypothetical protein